MVKPAKKRIGAAPGFTLDTLVRAVGQLVPTTRLPRKDTRSGGIRYNRSFMASCAPDVCVGDVLRDLEVLARARKRRTAARRGRTAATKK
jgi:hypothetical protein